MTIRRLERSEWGEFFSFASRFIAGKRADIETLSLQIGCRLCVRRALIHHLYYHPRRDVIEILLTGITHPIHRPRKMYVDDCPSHLVNFTVIDADGAYQIITLYEPLMLSAPANP